MRKHATASCWVLNSPEPTRQIKAFTKYLDKLQNTRRQAIDNISHVIVSACRETNPPTYLSFINQ